MKIGMVSLGCAKNRVDAEMMLGLLSRAGHTLVSSTQEADLVIVNTCGFIASAKQEAIEAILEVAVTKQEEAKLVVTGCLAQRNPQELHDEIPEIDALLGIGEIGDIAEHVERIMSGEHLVMTNKLFSFAENAQRILTTAPYTAYLKVADGCDNHCTFCAIPGIRGGFVSRPIEAILQEAQDLSQRGVKEIVLIAQDTTRYGLDLYNKPALTKLLDRLATTAQIPWIRLLYLYPEMIDEELLDVMQAHPSICRYLDVPIQHIDEDILHRMNRRGGRAAIERMYRLARDRGFTLRTTVLTGFPGESDAQFEELMSFLRDHPFDRLGAFAYSKEQGTKAATMQNQVLSKVKKQRERRIMQQQQAISAELLQKRVGATGKVLLEEQTNGIWQGRSQAEAPEIDGYIFVHTDLALGKGEMIDVAITASTLYDLEGVLV